MAHSMELILHSSELYAMCYDSYNVYRSQDKRLSLNWMCNPYTYQKTYYVDHGSECDEILHPLNISFLLDAVSLSSNPRKTSTLLIVTKAIQSASISPLNTVDLTLKHWYS